MTTQTKSWAVAQIGEVSEVNPRLDKSDIAGDLEVSFVPMPSVGAETGKIDVTTRRLFAEVEKGFTSFKQGDVLFAKITPCMENGKMVVVPEVIGGLAFGSTEFHVLRPANGIVAQYLYLYVSTKRFRADAEHNMTGAVGQRRVPTTYLSQAEVPIPPTAEQRRIVAKIEELFSELDKGIENLKQARAQLAVYRQALLKHAFEGKLTADWRATHAAQLEPADQLLARIRAEREGRYQLHLAEWKAAICAWEKTGKIGKRPTKPRSPEDPDKPSSEHVKRIWTLPAPWQWLQIGVFAFVTKLAGFEYTDYVKYDDAGDLQVIKAENAGRHGFRVTSYSRIHSGSVAHLKRSLVVGGELLVVFVGAGTGNVATVPHGSPFFLGPNIGMARAETEAISTRYVELFLRSPAGRDMILAASKAVAQPSLSMETIRQAPIAIPPTTEQQEIVRRLEDNLDAIAALEADIETNLQKSEALRQSILKKAFAGELVPQDPADEPAAALLARIRAERAATATTKPARRAKAPCPVA